MADPVHHRERAHREPVGVAYAPSFADGDPDAHGESESDDKPIAQPDDTEPNPDHTIAVAHDDQPHSEPKSVTNRWLPGGR
jgi:hypothetical protein